VTALFVVVYATTDWVTARRAFRVPVHAEWELGLPFWPWMSAVYLTIYPLMWSAPFVLPNVGRIRALATSLAVVILVAGAGFLLCPAQTAFPAPPADLGLWTPVFRVADQVNLDYNLVPSLHVALSVTSAIAYARVARPAARTLWTLWAAAIAVSTVMTHQHHLVDVLTGWALGWAGGAYAGASRQV
jgi:membrane-associated phospholipid phosphatase